jgi:hypothetical protein
MSLEPCKLEFVYLGSRIVIYKTPRLTMKTLLIALALVAPGTAHAQAWRNCVPDSIGPGGCDSIGPGGGRSIGPGGGQSIGPGGGLSIGPGGGQSIAPGGGLSIGPGGGLAIDRDRSRGLDPRTMEPFPPSERWPRR